MIKRNVRFILTIQLAFIFSVALGQGNYKYNLKRGNKYFKLGLYNKAIGEYKRAIRKRKGNAKITYKLGLAYLASTQKKAALQQLKLVYDLNPKVDKEIAYQLGLAYQYNNKFKEAKEIFKKYGEDHKKEKAKADRKILECDMAQQLIDHPRKVKIANMGPVINSRANDYTPIIARNGKALILTSNRPGSTGGIRLSDGSYYEDIYITYKENGEWGKPQKISPKINLKYHDAAASLSPDGKMLFLYYERGNGSIFTSDLVNNTWTTPNRLNENINTVFWETSASITADGNTLYFASNRPNGFGDLDIYRSEKNENGEWGDAINLGKEINTAGAEDCPYISPDGKTLFFGSSGHVGMGASDIYYSKLVNGHFTKPVNMGSPINTVYNDNYFVMSPDQRHGVFASLREEGEGDVDIYEVELLEPISTPTTPITPVDEEPVIAKNDEKETPEIQEEKEEEVVIAKHTPEPEKTEKRPEVKPTPETTTAVAKNEPKKETPKVEQTPVKEEEPIKEEEKVAAVETPPAKEEPEEEKASTTYFDEDFVNLQKELGVVTILKGKVIDATDAKPLYARLKLINNETNVAIAEITSDPETGEFELIIPHGGNYGVSTSKFGYLFNSINFNLPAFSEMQELDTHILLQRAEIGSKVILKNIFFDIGKSELRTESIAELDQIRALLSENKTLSVQINGHTDNVGNSVYNKVLSKKRAQSVVDYLTAHGIKTERVSAKGYGEERPLVSNDDELEGREINRRTEIEITGVGDEVASN